ncbi:hypothetical protein [Herbaspirillum huttiense]|uniref:hypothetical protein n=1 Tax=Herbaspirillum huttiense TaxID=863372 RepID=UPI0031DF3813
MSVKSSEVLRLAAEKALSSSWNAPLVASALDSLKAWNICQYAVYEFANMCGYGDTTDKEQSCMALCLAAAIAESEGD